MGSSISSRMTAAQDDSGAAEALFAQLSSELHRLARRELCADYQAETRFSEAADVLARVERDRPKSSS